MALFSIGKIFIFSYNIYNLSNDISLGLTLVFFTDENIISVYNNENIKVFF